MVGRIRRAPSRTGGRRGIDRGPLHQRTRLPGLLGRIAGVWLVALCLSLGLLSAPAWGGTTYVDGISDQSLPHWDTSFSEYFSPYWIGGGHIKYARYFTPWNVMKAGNAYYSGLSEWYSDAQAMGLTPVIALTTLGSPLPGSAAEYKEYVEKLLAKFPVPYLEAWNEPNGGGGPSAANAAEYWKKANTVCSAHSCTAIAGDFLDSQSNLVEYEQAYVSALGSTKPAIWGFHPYYSVKERDNQPTDEFAEFLPNKGAGAQIWFTEVGAYKCEYYGGKKEEFSEAEQASRAYWLTSSLMPEIKPTHVFYYEFMFKEGQSPPCNSESADTALYVPSSDPYAPNAPRAAASDIFSNVEVPAGYTGAASVANAESATLTGSVYPGGENTSHYHFEYGTSTSYGSTSAEGNAGSNFGRSEASMGITSLREGTTYHYRIATWNVVGKSTLSYGVDKTFTTPRRPGVSPSSASSISEERATLNGTVNPYGLDTHYYFQYGTSTSYGLTAPAPPGNDVGSGNSALPVSIDVTPLEPGIVYHYRLVASSSAGVTYGSDVMFTTFSVESSPRWVVRNPVTSDTWVYYVNSKSEIAEWNWDTAGWAGGAIGGSVAAGTSPSVIHDPTTGDTWVYYVNSKSEIAEWNWDTAGWAGGAIGGSVAAGTSPSVIHDPTTGDTWVYYVNSKDEIAELNWDTAGWQSGTIGGSVKPGTSPTVIHNPTTGDTWVYYVNSRSEIAEWNWDTAGWAGGAIGGSVASGTSPSVIHDPTTGDTWVYYVNSRSEIAEWNWDTAGWAGGAIGGSVAAGTSPSVIHDPVTGDTWVYYVNSRSEIAELNWDTAGWQGGAIGGSAKTGASPSVIHDPVLGDTWVYYMNSKGEIAEWNWDTVGWQGGTL